MDFETLKQIVTGNNPKLKQIHILWLCLNYTEKDPSKGPEIGCIWNSDNTFILNTRIHGEFIERKPNTINRGLRSHYFIWKKMSRDLRECIPSKFNFKEFPDQQNWDQRSCPGFTKKTTEAEAITWKYHELIPKNPKKIGQIKTPKVTKNTRKKDSLPTSQKIDEFSNFIQTIDPEFDEYVSNLSIFKNQKDPENPIHNQSMSYQQDFSTTEPTNSFNSYDPQIEDIQLPSDFNDFQNSNNNGKEEDQMNYDIDEFFYQNDPFINEENAETEFLSSFGHNTYSEFELEDHNHLFMESSSNEFLF